ncbi:hydroxymethylglutaryl-CoA reductase, degradative [Candidatus Micrarchaeota archaeon]|nr:hydroxymethylglutaryl-CoA reductase, degradative [Candidatus Micrarchaeota archaeon]
MEKFSGFYKLTIEERMKLLKSECKLSEEEVKILLDTGSLSHEAANHMVENMVGATHIPLGIAPGFVVNGKEYVVPMAIEEPSVIAAASKGAKLAKECGGFTADADEPVMMGQVQIVGMGKDALAKFEKNKAEINAKAKELCAQMEKYGGGLRGVGARILETNRGSMLIAEFAVDVRDAMGANTVNTMLEGVSPLIVEKCGGKARLRILTNLALLRKVRAKCVWKKGVVSEEEIEGILDGYALAANDIFRCATHNKGIMNGIDAVAVATGNDWRAVEAGAHSFAAMGGYRPLTRFHKDGKGNLVGEIELPLAVGTIGGSIKTNPVAQISLKILGAKSARELSMVMAAVGLAQNFAALRALGTEGIQAGHMRLHGANIAVIAGAKPEEVEKVAKKLAESKEYSAENAKKILKGLRGG